MTKKQKFIPVYITKREAQMIEAIRALTYGKAIIHKQEGVPVRVEINRSVMLKDDNEAINLKIKE